MINIMIVDDQVLLCESLGFILNNDDEIHVMGYAHNGEDLLQLLQTKKPDIVLIDIEMPKLDGISTIKIIKEKYPKIRSIVLTTFEDEDNIMESFVVGADGYIVKNIGHEDLVLTIKSVYKGLCVIDESVKEMMVKRFKGLSNYKVMYQDKLSENEIVILRLIASGKSNKEIALKVNYSEGTIKNKISKILNKLEMNDRMQLAIFAIENGIV